ncbi:beta-lactamase superfamily domain-containing protein [Apodospora peruviana]|uniref:Beta-lactamase superfamily domain-containing protein n=1 Tax=Apodospora peruviana TaxID=516989 RepID=A0AAE0I3I2_9PEZI|nr:beta-lactamase superfamily domain-containing protein [Apodospora peruviana]
MAQLDLNPSARIPLMKIQTHHLEAGPKLPVTKSHTHPRKQKADGEVPENGSVYFIGNATTVIEWHDIRILTDPNFLHAGDHVHLGPGVTAERLKDPIVDMHQLPPLDCILLSHYHEDHFDRKVEESLNRAFPIVTTPHAKKALTSKEDPFQAVYDLDFFQGLVMSAPPASGSRGWKRPAIKVTGMPGKHVPPGPLSTLNDLLGAVPPTNGWVLELGYISEGQMESVGYRIYISGDTLFVDELKEIPKWLRNEKIDLMLVHLGGTTIPGPHTPLFMVTMDGKQGVQLMRLMDPDVTVPIHFDDYSVMLSGLDDFRKEVEAAGFGDRVVYLDRGDEYRFSVRE